MGRIAINDSELEELPVFNDQGILSLCKQKGMPVKGVVNFSIDPAYEYSKEYDSLRCSTIIAWSRKNDA